MGRFWRVRRALRQWVAVVCTYVIAIYSVLAGVGSVHRLPAVSAFDTDVLSICASGHASAPDIPLPRQRPAHDPCCALCKRASVPFAIAPSAAISILRDIFKIAHAAPLIDALAYIHYSTPRSRPKVASSAIETASPEVA